MEQKIITITDKEEKLVVSLKIDWDIDNKSCNFLYYNIQLY